MSELKINLYVAPREAATLTMGPTTWPITRSILCAFMNGAAGEWFDEIDHDGRQQSLCCVHASDATHTAIQADARVTRILPVLSATAAQIAARLDTPLLDLYTAPQLVTFRDKMTAVGYDLDDIPGTATVRQVMTRLINHLFVHQRFRDAALRDLFSLSLTATVGSISTARRNAIKAWMTGHGIDSTWIAGTTTVRQVVRYVVANVPPLAHRFGRLP
jgi:hypothetical protein